MSSTQFTIITVFVVVTAIVIVVLAAKLKRLYESVIHLYVDVGRVADKLAQIIQSLNRIASDERAHTKEAAECIDRLGERLKHIESQFDASNEAEKDLT